MTKYKGVKHYKALNLEIDIEKSKKLSLNIVLSPKTNQHESIKRDILNFLTNKKLTSTLDISIFLNLDNKQSQVSRALIELFSEQKIYYQKRKSIKYWSIL